MVGSLACGSAGFTAEVFGADDAGVVTGGTGAAAGADDCSAGAVDVCAVAVCANAGITSERRSMPCS